MSRSDSIARPSRRHPVVRRVVSRWRALTGGAEIRDADRRTLVACSAGADSSALALALSTVNPKPVLAHIRHDMRSDAEADADLAAARRLAVHLDLDFETADIAVAGGSGNVEANARSARYAALAEIASRRGLAHVATGHHADDQLETLLMRLARGSGPRGLRGILDARQLSAGVTLVRPMLAIGRTDAETLCRDVGWTWAEDRTNADRSRLRAAIRHQVIPSLRDAAPAAARSANRVARLQREAHAAIGDVAAELNSCGAAIANGYRWPRNTLLGAPGIIAREAIRQGLEASATPRRHDRLTSAALRRAEKFLRQAGPGGVWVADGMKATVCGDRVEVVWA